MQRGSISYNRHCSACTSVAKISKLAHCYNVFDSSSQYLWSINSEKSFIEFKGLCPSKFTRKNKISAVKHSRKGYWLILLLTCLSFCRTIPLTNRQNGIRKSLVASYEFKKRIVSSLSIFKIFLLFKSSWCEAAKNLTYQWCIYIRICFLK